MAIFLFIKLSFFIARARLLFDRCLMSSHFVVSLLISLVQIVDRNFVETGCVRSWLIIVSIMIFKFLIALLFPHLTRLAPKMTHSFILVHFIQVALIIPMPVIFMILLRLLLPLILLPLVHPQNALTITHLALVTILNRRFQRILVIIFRLLSISFFISHFLLLFMTISPAHTGLPCSFQLDNFPIKHKNFLNSFLFGYDFLYCSKISPHHPAFLHRLLLIGFLKLSPQLLHIEYFHLFFLRQLGLFFILLSIRSLALLS